MKTTHKLIGTAIVALFTLSVNAQNTKSVNQFSGKLTEMVSVKMEYAAHELSSQLENLKAFVKYSPSDLNEDLYVMDIPVNFNMIQDQLEKDVKFIPSEINNAAYENNESEMNDILNELESTVKYQSGEYQSLEIKRILSDLSKDVKYVPSAEI